MSVESDLAGMVTGWDSQEVVLAGVTTRGLLDLEDSIGFDAGGDPVQVRRTTLRLRRAEFLDAAGALTVSRGNTATVDETDYQVTEILAGEQDGRELLLAVRKV